MAIREYLRNRFYLRGFTPLGLFNTAMAFVANRVIVVKRDRDTKKRAGWFVAKGTDFPPIGG